MKAKYSYYLKSPRMIVTVHKFRGQNSLRGEGYNSLTLNHVYLFKQSILLIFHIYLSHLIIPVGPHFAIRVPFIVTISGESILGPDKYD